MEEDILFFIPFELDHEIHMFANLKYDFASQESLSLTLT